MATDESDENTAEWEVDTQESEYHDERDENVKYVQEGLHPLDQFDRKGKKGRTKDLAVKLFFLNIIGMAIAVASIAVHVFAVSLVGAGLVYLNVKLVIDEVYEIARVTYDAVEADIEA